MLSCRFSQAIVMSMYAVSVAWSKIIRCLMLSVIQVLSKNSATTCVINHTNNPSNDKDLSSNCSNCIKSVHKMEECDQESLYDRKLYLETVLSRLEETYERRLQLTRKVNLDVVT